MSPADILVSTYNAASFSGATKEARITNAIRTAVADKAERALVPEFMLPYDASLVTFNDAVRMVREGGDWSVYDVKAYGANGLDVALEADAVDDFAACNAAVLAARNNSNSTVHVPFGVYFLGQQLNFSGVSVVGDGAVGAFGSHFVPLATFTGDSVLLLDGTTSGGASNCRYEKFRVRGTMLYTLPAGVHGLKLLGVVLFNTFGTIGIEAVLGHGMLLDDNGTNGLNVNTFINVQVEAVGMDGWRIDGGQRNVLINPDIEGVGGIGINITSSAVSHMLIDAPWVEGVGTGKDGITITGGASDIRIRVPRVSGYGSSPATTGHGVNLGTCRRVVLDGGTYTGRAASASGSRKIFVNANANEIVLENFGTEMAAVDLEILGAAVVRNSNNPELNTYDQIITSNGLLQDFTNGTIAANVTRFLLPGIGTVSATETDVRAIASGNLPMAHLRVEVTTAPGAGETYIVTVMKNGVATLLTATVSGTGTTASEVATVITFAPGDNWSLRVVSSVGAAAISTAGGIRITVGIRR